jgi:hypothetical protein
MSSFSKKNNSLSNRAVPSKEQGEESFFGVQAKLNIGKSNDKYEVEADATADKIVSNKESNSKGFFTPTQTSLVQKQAAKEDNEVQKKEEKEEKEPIQRSATSDTTPTNTSALESKLQSSKGGGSPLGNAAKKEMESGFGTDFSDVRIHNDATAIQMNKELGAQAFASGNDVYFNQGKYNPESQSGKHLLAHELTHTLQQGAKPDIQKQNTPHLDSLNEMLDSFNVPEDEVILMCSQLNASERAIVLSDGSYKRRMASALDVAEMTRAVNNLGLPLNKKLEWVKEAATFGTFFMAYSEIKDMITSADQPQRDALKTDTWKSFFVDVCTDATIIEALNDLQFDLITKLTWLKAEVIITSWEVDYAIIKPWITHANTTQAERDSLKTNTTVGLSFFVDICTNTTMVEALNDLQFDLVTKLTWLNAEMSVTSWELDYATIKPWIISATQVERDSLQTNTTVGMNFFVSVCTNTTMVEALNDLQFDLVTKLTWLNAEMTITSWELDYATIKPWIIASSTTQIQRDALKTNDWKAFFISVCTNANIIEAVTDLNFDVPTQLDWITTEGGDFVIILTWLLNHTTDYDIIRNYITSASASERQAALADASIRTLINSKLTAPFSVGIFSHLLLNSMFWKNPDNNDFFAHFVTSGGSAPLPATATMNCWESIMYAAFLANKVDAAWIQHFYNIAFAASDPNAVIWNQLGWNSALPTYPPAVPTAGQLIFYTEIGRPYPGHVAMAIDATHAISLWSQPNNTNFIQRINITDLTGVIQVANPPW